MIDNNDVLYLKLIFSVVRFARCYKGSNSTKRTKLWNMVEVEINYIMFILYV